MRSDILGWESTNGKEISKINNMKEEENNTIMTREDSLSAIKDWDFMPNQNGKVIPIPLTMPRGISVKDFGNLVKRFMTRVITDGDVRPGTASLLVFSEPLARKLVDSYGSYLIKQKTFVDANAL